MAAPLKVVIPLDDLSGSIIYEEIFIDRICDLSKESITPDLIIDLGSHMGMFAILASKYFSKSPILCFEPSPTNRAFLEKNIHLNVSANAVILPFAANVSGGVVGFQEDGFGGQISEDGALSNSFKTVALSMPDVLLSIKDLSLLIKIDIEGAEEEMMPALLEHLPDNCSIFLETHQTADRTSELMRPFRGAGFIVEEIRCRSFDGIDYKEWFLERIAGSRL